MTTSAWLNEPVASLFAQSGAAGRFAIVYLTFPIYEKKKKTHFALNVASTDTKDESRLRPDRRADARCVISGLQAADCEFAHLVDHSLGAAAFSLVVTAVSTKYSKISEASTNEEVKAFYRAQYE